MAAPGVAIVREAAGVGQRRSRNASYLAIVAAFAAAAVLALVGPWRLHDPDASGSLVVFQATGGKESEQREPQAEAAEENWRDEMLPGLVGAVRQAFVALVEKQCDIVFDEVDHDSNGRLSSAELHVAVLLAYGRLNQILGHMALSPPRTSEVKELLAASDDGGDGQLTRDEFREIFVRKFTQQVAAQAAARLIVQKLLVPAGGVSLNLLVDHWHLSKRLENVLNRHSGWTGPKGLVVRSARRTITSNVLSRLGRALGPVVNMHISAAIAKGTKLEDAIERLLQRGESM